ncbi:RNase H domain-containing protein [Trichonephila clavata]|uniref:RNase H domain-containing protein n=1 Tax=Trichonephila clavata TaxID=2740835 RepID=A0A8X6LB26_TRICU|nr:RNase H domain-containing protein [Trichonephila clavata]
MEIDKISTKRPATGNVQEAAKILKPSIRIESGGIQTTKEVEDVMLLDLTWSVLGNPLGSDHFSLSYATPIACATLHQPRWKFDQADWETFRTQADITEDMQWSLINTIPEIAETFAKTSSCNNYTPAFQALKRREERVKLNFSSSNEEGYNSPLTLLELRIALHRSGNTAAGPDRVHYIMLRHLSESSILSLLLLFNRIWETQVFPTQWCHAHVLPFSKPGKDPTSANNYHPIALTSCLSKLMERIVSARLMFHLESHNLLSPLQSGFRKSRSTTDNLIRLETSIREAFVKKQYNISVFFDIKKAYDMSCRSQNQKCQGPKHPQSINKYSLGADRTSLLRFYRALIRSKLDYGSVVYSSACKSLLKILDPVHHQGLRLCLGAFRTSPVESLYAEAYELPLDCGGSIYV